MEAARAKADRPTINPTAATSRGIELSSQRHMLTDDDRQKRSFHHALNWAYIALHNNIPRTGKYCFLLSTRKFSLGFSMAESVGPLNNLPEVKTYLTGHDEKTGKANIQSARPAHWQSYENDLMGFNVVYTTSEFPASLAENRDIASHDKLMSSGKLGLVNRNGTVCRHVDFAPGLRPIMHRTQSLDYGIVLEGTIEMVLDSGETQVMHRGDVAVQRATMHAWRNPSKTEWCRMIFVLQDCEKVVVGGEALKESLGNGIEGVPPSGNDE